MREISSHDPARNAASAAVFTDAETRGKGLRMWPNSDSVRAERAPGLADNHPLANGPLTVARFAIKPDS